MLVDAGAENNEKGKMAEDWVQYRVGQMGGTYVRAPEKTRLIDGYIILADTEMSIQFHIAVQVKGGNSYVASRRRKDRGNYIYLKLNTKDVMQWHLLKVPIVVVWVQDPSDPGSKSLWADATRAKKASGRLKIHPGAAFNQDALKKLLSFAKQHSGTPSVPELKSSPLISNKVCDIKKAAKKFYNAWQKESCISPAFGRVDITLQGWRHLTRNTLAQLDITHRLALLPFAKETLEIASQSQFVRRLESYRSRRELHIVNGLYKPKHKAELIVEVVVEIEKKGKRIRKAKLYSLYERRSWRTQK